jgi:hypothetical protein
LAEYFNVADFLIVAIMLVVIALHTFLSLFLSRCPSLLHTAGLDAGEREELQQNFIRGGWLIVAIDSLAFVQLQGRLGLWSPLLLSAWGLTKLCLLRLEENIYSYYI